MSRSKKSFSPLFIGEVSSTPKPDRLGFGCSYLSVPSSSGRSLQHFDVPVEVITSHMLSVPSSSGRSLQRRKEEAPRSTSHTFQSPLHRGGLFNFKKGGRMPQHLNTFSPLFIGRSLQRLTLAIGARWRRPFSPLFIGEVSSTSKAFGLF